MSEDQAEDWTNLISDWIAMADRMQAGEGAGVHRAWPHHHVQRASG
jgi:hypothetical protein